MDYVDGSSLAHLALRAREQGHPIPPGIVIRIVLDASAGLQAAHDLTDTDGTHLGVVHRDVSPHNILIGSDGVAKIADFGIAKAMHHSLERTESGVLKGKLSYMAPEYLREQVLDARSDVYSMGVVLWELLADRRLFRGKNEVETMENISKLEPPLLSQVRPDLGTQFDSVVARALERDRSKRLQSARAFLNELEFAAKARGVLASHGDVESFLQTCLGSELAQRKAIIHAATSRENTKTDEATVTLREPDLVEARPEPLGPGGRATNGEVEDMATLPSGEVIQLEPAPHTVALPLVRVASTPDVGEAVVDATQPSFAHSQVGPVSSLPSRGGARAVWLLAGLAVIAISVAALGYWRWSQATGRETSSAVPVVSSAPIVERPFALTDVGPSVRTDSAQSDAAPIVSATQVERSSRSDTSPIVSATRVEPSSRPPDRARLDAGAPRTGGSAAGPAQHPVEWSPEPNPYEK
jgi:serine/threonine-protein kinase